mgnify:CR=1 FL=1
MSGGNRGGAAETAADGSAVGDFDLPCHRSRVLRFRGRHCLGVASGPSAGQVGYALHLYETVEGRLVLTVEAHLDLSGHERKRTAWKVGSLAEALSRLEAYDAATDVPVPVDPDDPDLSPAEMIAHALTLRARIDVSRRVFRDLRQELADAVARCDPVDPESAPPRDVAATRRSGAPA